MPSRAGTYNAAFLEEDATVRILAVGIPLGAGARDRPRSLTR